MSWEVWLGICLVYLVFSRVLARIATGSWLGTPSDFNKAHRIPAHSKGLNGPDDCLILWWRRRQSGKE
jgi:hypothetical protein